MNRTMFPEEFKEIGTALLEEYGLKGWRIILDDCFKGHNTPALAFTFPATMEIHVSLKAVKKFDYSFCYNVIKHEIAHALDFTKNSAEFINQIHRSHGKEWREYAYNCGVFREELHPYSKLRSTITWKLHVLNQE